MAEIQKQLDTATLGPAGFLSKSISSAFIGIGHILKSPKLLLPTIALSAIWIALSYLRLNSPDNEVVKILSILTFAQGGMYAGSIGAIGGVFGKALISWLTTSLLMPFLSGKKSAKPVQMKIGSAFRINTARGFALFIAGIGTALILYNFKTGNGTTENGAIAAASIVAVIRSLRNPRGFIVEFIRSFSKGRMSRKKASNFGGGLIIGYVASILIALLASITGPQWYILGMGLLILSMVIATLFRGKRAAARTASVFLIGIFSVASIFPFTKLGFAQTNWKEPFEAYGFRNLPAQESTLTQQQVDYNMLIKEKPPTGIKFTPLAITMEGGGEKQILSLSENYSEVIPNSSTRMPLESVSLEYSDDKYDFSGEYTISNNNGNWSANSDISFNFEGYGMGTAIGETVSYSGFDSQEGGFNFFIGAPHFYVSQYEFVDLINPNNLYAEVHLNFLVSEAKESWQADFYGKATILLRIDEITFDTNEAPPSATGKWMHKETNYYAFVDEGSNQTRLEYFNGTFRNETGVMEDGKTLYHRYSENNNLQADYIAEFSSLESSYDSEAQVKIDVNANIMLNGGSLDQEEPNSRVIFGGIISGKRMEQFSMSDPNFYDLGAFTYSNKTLSGNIPQGVTLGQEITIERVLGTYFWPQAIVIADTYVWEATVASGAEENNEDEDLIENEGFPWEDFESGDYDWNERASEDEMAMINIASTLGAIIGAGAALAGGFGGFTPRGPGNLNIPGGKYDPSDGTLVVDYPGGSQEIYVLNPETGDFESSYGSKLSTDDLDRARRDLEIDKAIAKVESQLVAERNDGDTGYWNRLNQIEKLKQKYIKSSNEDNNLSSHMAKHLQKIQDNINNGKGIDEKALGRLRDFHGRFTRGEISSSSQIPGEYSSYEHVRDTLDLTTEEVARGETGLAISLRIVAGIATAGKSEFGFEIAKSVYTTKDYVNQGMDNWSDIARKLAIQTVAEEGFGRVVGAGLDFGGSVVSSVAKTASDALSTTKLGSAALKKLSNVSSKVGDFLGQDIVKTTKDIFGMGPKAANEATQSMKLANAKLAKEAIQNANKQLDDAVKVASNQSDDLAKAVGSKADDMSKTATAKAKAEDAVKAQKTNASDSIAKESDEAAESAAKQAEEKAAEAKNASDLVDPHERAAKKWNDAMDKGKQDAKKEIQKYKEANKGIKSETSKRDELFRKGQQIGDQKVANLKRAQDRLSSHPNAKDAKDAYDEALRAVQQDKYAMNSLKEYKGPGANELRGKFNMRNEQHTQAALQNTRERLAQEHGVNPEDIKFVEATNTPGAGGASKLDASKTASKLDSSRYTNPNYKGSVSADDMVSNSARFKSVPMDKDVTGRIYNKKTGEWIDIPKEDVQRIYNQELYKTHHNGKLPTTNIDAREVIDESAIKDFAKKMDHTVTDRTGADAFGRGDADLRNILNKQTREVKQFEDISSVTKTMEYKSNEWFAEAEKMREEAMELVIDKNNQAAVDKLLRQAESTQAEGVRQMVKMFDDQVAQQIKAVTASGKNVRIPEKLVKSMKILDQIGKPDGITMAQAEDILKNMNTSIEDVAQQSSSLMEVIAKFK